MPKYQVSLIERPKDWEPQGLDDVPPQPSPLLESIAEKEGLFPAVQEAIHYNETSKEEQGERWAVVVEPGSLGRVYHNTRLCTPVTYKVTAIWWPQGWEPSSPMDVPNCVWKAQGDVGRIHLSYRRALASVRGLNRQAMAQATSMWYVLMAIENEPVSHTISYDPAGAETTVEVRRLHVVRPAPAGHGDCTHCPAHSFECARANWANLEETLTDSQTKVVSE